MAISVTISPVVTVPPIIAQGPGVRLAGQVAEHQADGADEQEDAHAGHAHQGSVQQREAPPG